MMHPSIAKYQSLNADDLCQSLGLNETRLKPELTFFVSRRELLEQDYSLQHSTLGLSWISLLVYMSALVLLQYLSQRNLFFLPCLSPYPRNARLS